MPRPLALAQAGAAARGATAYVTLEPCAHHGQTPPCAEALIAAGIARAVIAVADTDPRVSGKGIEMLRAAGIDVETGMLADQAQADLAGFLRVAEGGRPWVTLKLASSFDGRIATATGQSQWITGPQARRWVHALRARHDAVVVGAGTARHDDPSLTVRDLGITHQPVRIVTSRRLDLPLMSKLARTARDSPLWICHGRDADTERLRAWEQLGARLIACDIAQSQIDPADMLAQLGRAGLTRIFCEGGAALAASLLSAGAVDDLIGFSAGFAIGAEGLPAIGALGLERLEAAQGFDLVDCRPVGPDLLHQWRRRPG